MMDPTFLKDVKITLGDATALTYEADISEIRSLCAEHNVSEGDLLSMAAEVSKLEDSGVSDEEILSALGEISNENHSNLSGLNGPCGSTDSCCLSGNLIATNGPLNNLVCATAFSSTTVLEEPYQELNLSIVQSPPESVVQGLPHFVVFGNDGLTPLAGFWDKGEAESFVASKKGAHLLAWQNKHFVGGAGNWKQVLPSTYHVTYGANTGNV